MTNPIEMPLGTALWRGLQCRCPACGEGRLFGHFVKVAPACTQCGEAFHHHRADDFPAYLVIVLVGHLILPLVLWIETAFVPNYWIHAALWLPAVVGLAIGLLQPIKGAVVALQWHTGMHGFAASRQARAQPILAIGYQK